MFYRFGVEAERGSTGFTPVGLVQASTREEAVKKMKDWESQQSREVLQSYLPPQEPKNCNARVCLDYAVNNYLQVVIM